MNDISSFHHSLSQINTERKSSMEMYEVVAKCGHVGRDYFTMKSFAIIAESKAEAAAMVRQLPRVKHHHKDAIHSVSTISTTRYNDIIHDHYADAYFGCSCIQDQRRYAQVDRIPESDHSLNQKESSRWAGASSLKESHSHSEEQSKATYYRKMLIRNPKKYMNNYVDLERYAG